MDQTISVSEALSSRHSVRAFLAKPVDRAVIEQILTLASQSPSGSNIQPWKVWVTAGAKRDRICSRIHAAHEADEPGHEEGYVYYPPEWFEPHLTRRRQLGKALYGLVNAPKGDVEGMKRQNGRNYLLFDAPVGLFFALDKRHGQSAWIDLGCFLQSIMLAARGFGLDTCPQQSFAKYHRILREELAIPEGDVLVCGMAIGYADPEAPVNRLRAERVPLTEFAEFYWER
jgi:nitroreductase